MTSPLTVLEYDDGCFMSGIPTAPTLSSLLSPPKPDGVQSTQSEAADGRTENKDVSSSHVFNIVDILAVLVGANVDFSVILYRRV